MRLGGGIRRAFCAWSSARRVAAWSPKSGCVALDMRARASSARRLQADTIVHRGGALMRSHFLGVSGCGGIGTLASQLVSCARPRRLRRERWIGCGELFSNEQLRGFPILMFMERFQKYLRKYGSFVNLKAQLL